MYFDVFIAVRNSQIQDLEASRERLQQLNAKLQQKDHEHMLQVSSIKKNYSVVL